MSTMSDAIASRDAFESPTGSIRTAAVRNDLAAIAGWFAALSVIYWGWIYFVCGAAGFPLDDAFIHLQFARNLFESGQMAFNVGVPSSGCTAPAFPLLIAAAYSVVRSWFVASYLVCGLCSLGTAWAVYGIMRSWTGRTDLARWAGILTVVTCPTVIQAWSGMEASAYSLMCLLGLLTYGGGTPARRAGGSAIFAATIWFRPEFMVVLPLIVVERFVARRREGRSPSFILELCAHLLIWLVIGNLYALYHWTQDGHLVPSTFAAKAVAPFALKPEWLDGLAAALKRGDWVQALLSVSVLPFMNLVLIGISLGVICLPLAFGLRKAAEYLWRIDGVHHAGAVRLLLLIFVGYPAARAVIEPHGTIWFQTQRYFAHLTPLFVLIVMLPMPVTHAIVRRAKWNWSDVPLGIQRRRTIGWALAASILVSAVTVASVKNINDMQVTMADWVRSQTEPEAVIATNDIGAIGFLSRRQILDTVGLVEPAIVDHYLAGGTTEAYLRARDPAYVIVFPGWYPDLTARADLLSEAFSVELGLNVVCGGAKLVAYKPLWGLPEW